MRLPLLELNGDDAMDAPPAVAANPFNARAKWIL